MLVSAAVLSAVASAFAMIVLLLLTTARSAGCWWCMLIVVGAGVYRSHASTRRRHQALALIHEFVSGGVGAESLESLAEPAAVPDPPAAARGHRRR